MTYALNLCLATLAVAVVASSAVRLNEIVLGGTHNSYHVATLPLTIPFWNYTLPELSLQLDNASIRCLEFDTENDGTGNWPVHHVDTYDPGTHCQNLTACISFVRQWSVANPGAAVPYIIMIEVKSASALTEAQMDALDALALAAWGGNISQIITPTQIKSNYSTIRDAVESMTAWPTLAEAAGKAMFIMLDDSSSYGVSNSSSRLMFPMLTIADVETNSRAAVIIQDEPLGYVSNITALVQRGFIVRTTADDSYYGPIVYNRTQQLVQLFNVIDQISPDGYLNSTDINAFFTAAASAVSSTLIQQLFAYCSCSTTLGCTIAQFPCVYSLVSTNYGLDLFALANYSDTLVRRAAALKSGAQIVSTNWPLYASSEGYIQTLGAEYISNPLFASASPSSSSSQQSSSDLCSEDSSTDVTFEVASSNSQCDEESSSVFSAVSSASPQSSVSSASPQSSVSSSHSTVASSVAESSDNADAASGIIPAAVALLLVAAAAFL